jgi:hypothetical protein
MASLVPVPAEERGRFVALYAPHRELTAVIFGGIAGGLGQLVVDDFRRPHAARLSIGCYEIFGGDPRAPAAAELVAGVTPPRELVYANDAGWRRLLLDVHGPRVADRPMRSFDASGLAADRLRAAADRIDAGFELLRLDARLAAQLDAGLEPHGRQVYGSVAALLAAGLGFGAIGSGELACAATSYAVGAGQVEVAIATRSAFRGRGLAEAVAARLLLHCLESGLRPHWNVSNPVSQRLALRLGLQPGGDCEVLYLGA